jgi:hypothetical protein
MKDQIIEIMKCAGYEFIEEKPEGRLLFYETEMEQTVQLWLKEDDESLRGVMLLITQRAYNRGASDGKYGVIRSIKEILQIESTFLKG